MSTPTLRSRHIPPPPPTPHDSSSSYSSTPASSDSDDASTPKPATPKPVPRLTLLDILRVLSGLLLLTTTLSYYTTSTLLWTLSPPPFTRPARIRAWLRGPLLLTDAALARYDGSDARLPILLALNGTIYDVTQGRRFYGPGGMYAGFGGRDATRAFVTGCFEGDLTGDLRGVEEVFVPVGVDGDVDAEEALVRREREWRVAREMVEETVKGWEKLFDGGKGGAYFRVGRLVREEGWEKRLGPVRELCEKARRGRVKRGQGSAA